MFPTALHRICVPHGDTSLDLALLSKTDTPRDAGSNDEGGLAAVNTLDIDSRSGNA